jgi:hypothetical protein
MKLNKNIKVFCLRIKDYSLSIKLLNSNERLSKIIERLKKSSNRYVKLDYLLNLNYSKKSFSGVIGSQVVHINLFENDEFKISILEIVGDTTFTLEEIKNSTLFIEELELLSVIGIHDNIFHRSLKRIISSQIHLN